jgi:hypothetical protein
MQADSLNGDSITVTSVFNTDAAQQWDFSNITAERINAGVFSDWMLGFDSGTNITIIPGVPDGNQTRNEFDVNFSNGDLNDGEFHDYTPTDTLQLTLQLSPADKIFNVGFFALTIANDVQVPTSSVNGGTFTFDLTNLDQINGNGGQARFIFDVEDAAPQAPEPGTTGLVAIGGQAVLIASRKRARKTARASLPS